MKVLYFALSALFTCCGALLLFASEKPVVGLMGVCLFGACLLISIWDLLPSRKKAHRGDAKPQGQSLVVKSNIAQYFIIAVAAAGMAAAGAIMVGTESAPIIGCLTLGFFGPGSLLLFWQAVDRRPRLIIDGDGVTDRWLGVGCVVWADIEWAYLTATGQWQFVYLDVRDPAAYLNKRSWLRAQWLGACGSTAQSHLVLNLTGIAAHPEDVLRLVLWHILQNNGGSGRYPRDGSEGITPVEHRWDAITKDSPRDKGRG